MPLSRKRPPPVPVFQKSYWVMVSPSDSLAVNSCEAAKTCPCTAAWLEPVTTAPASIGAVTVKLCQSPQPVPSFARTQRRSAPEPL
jgi:hypothetical protein